MRHKGFPGGRGKVPTNAAEARDGVQSPGQEGHPEQGMAPYCSIPAGKIPWTEERQAPVLGSQGVRHNRATSHACTRPSTALLAESQGISRRPRTERAKPEARVSPSYRCGWTEMKTSSTGFITRTSLKCLCCALDRP